MDYISVNLYSLNFLFVIQCIKWMRGGQGPFVPCLSITIDEATNSITATCLDDDSGSCTFTNVIPPRNVPTLSQYSLIAMAGVLGLIAFAVLRRKKATA